MPVPRPKLNDAGAAHHKAQYDVSDRGKCNDAPIRSDLGRQVDGRSPTKAPIQIAVLERQFGRVATIRVRDGELDRVEEE